MLSDSRSQGSKNYEHNVFSGIPARPGQEDLFSQFLDEQDLSPHTIDAIIYDLRKFAKWFTGANREPWEVSMYWFSVNWTNAFKWLHLFLSDLPLANQGF